MSFKRPLNSLQTAFVLIITLRVLVVSWPTVTPPGYQDRMANKQSWIHTPRPPIQKELNRN
jgi:hypothetical protein